MFTEVRAIIHRSAPTILEDTVGMAALAIILFGALHLPSIY